jgi:hypothetical protein
MANNASLIAPSQLWMIILGSITSSRHSSASDRAMIRPSYGGRNTTMVAEHPAACVLCRSACLGRHRGTGLVQDFAPSRHYLQQLLAPIIERMAEIKVAVVRPGYVPDGARILELTVWPSGRLTGITLPEPGHVEHVRGIALATARERRVNVRMAVAC